MDHFKYCELGENFSRKIKYLLFYVIDEQKKGVKENNRLLHARAGGTCYTSGKPSFKIEIQSLFAYRNLMMVTCRVSSETI